MKKRNILMATLFMCLMSVVFFSTKVEAAPIWIYHPKRTVNFTIKYVDDKTGKEIAPRVTTEIKYQRDLKAWQSNNEIYWKGPWKVITPSPVNKVESPDFTERGYTKPSEDVVDPVTFCIPDDADVRTNNYSNPRVCSVKYKHRVVTATAENPGDPLSPLEESRPDGPKWPTGTTKDDLVQSVSRTIQYLNQETQTTLSPQRLQQVNYTRNADVDAVTGTFLTYSTWHSTNPIFAAVASPKLAGQGYKSPNPLTVPELETKVSDQASTVIVNYDFSKVAIEAKNSTMIAGPTATW